MEEKKTNEISELDITLEGKILFGSEGNEELLINLLNGIIPAPNWKHYIPKVK